MQETEIQEPGSRGRPAVGLMVETEASALSFAAHQPGRNLPLLRDLSSKLVVEERLELPLVDALPLLERVTSHIDRFLPAIRTSWSA